MADPARLPPSLWAATAEPAPELDPLEGERICDVAIVGGGFTGLSAALHAAKAGVSVCVIEAAEPGWGASGRNGGQAVAELKWSPDAVVRKLGAERGERLVSFAGNAPAKVFDLIENYDIACAASRKGWVCAAHSQAANRTNRAGAEQWARRGFDVEYVDAEEAARLTGSPIYFGAVNDKRCGKLNPLGYARGLARAALSEGAEIFVRSMARTIERIGDGWRVKTARGEVRAGHLILATNAYGGDIYKSLGRSYYPVNSFIVASKPLSPNVLGTLMPDGHCMADTRRLLIYCRTDPEGRLVVGGRGNHHDPQGADDFAHVQKALHHLFPQVGDVDYDFRWSGRVCITPDMYPHVHLPEPGLSVALGYTGRGVAFGTALGAAMGRHAVSGDEAELPLPVTRIRPIPFHSGRRLVLAAATLWYRALDAVQ